MQNVQNAFLTQIPLEVQTSKHHSEEDLVKDTVPSWEGIDAAWHWNLKKNVFGASKCFH